MNAMVGDAGEFTHGGTNVNNPSYHQFLKLSDFTATPDIFVFIEEHPDSINDGYFLNKAYEPEWTDLPASYHNGSANLSFADGHAELHHWIIPSTRRPSSVSMLGRERSDKRLRGRDAVRGLRAHSPHDKLRLMESSTT